MTTLDISESNKKEICHDLLAFLSNYEIKTKSNTNDKNIKQSDNEKQSQRANQKNKQWHKLSQKQLTNYSVFPVVQEKEFMWDSSREKQLWYKNLVIPTIKVCLPFEQSVENYSKILARMRCFKQLENKNFQEVELSGELEQEFKEQKPLFFSGLKFIETTFISRENTILASYVSDSIYVEARKKSRRFRAEKLTSNYLETFSPSEKQRQQITPIQKGCNYIQEIKELYQLNSYLNSLKEMEDAKISPFILAQLFPNIIRVYINNVFKISEQKNEIILTIQQRLNNNSAYYLQTNDNDQNESDCIIHLSISKSVQNELFHLVDQIQQKLIKYKPQTLSCIFQNNSYLNQMYKQINSSKQIAKLIEENYKIFNQKSELTLKFSQAQKSISKNEDFLNQLEENRSKIQYSFKQFSKQENQTYYKYTTSINLKDFPPLEPLLTKKVKAITNKSKLQNFNSKISQNEFEEKETSKECIFNNKQSENEKNTSIVSTQQINFTSPQTQVLQIDSTPLKISLSTEDFCTKQISKESPKFSQNSQYNPQFNVSQSSIYYADELQLLNKEFNYIQNVQNSSSQTFKEEEKINKITQLPINMVQNQNQYNYYQQANLSNSNYIYQNDILSNIKIDSQKVAENQLPNLYRYNQLPIQQQIQYNHFNQQQISHLFSNVQITQQQQLYLYQQQQNNYLQELNIQQQIYNNQNTMNNMNELNKQQFFGTVMPSQHTPHQLFYNNNQQIQNLHQPNYIKQQSASFFI